MPGVHAHFGIPSGKHISNNYGPYFNRFDFVVISSYVELPWYDAEGEIISINDLLYLWEIIDIISLLYKKGKIKWV